MIRIRRLDEPAVLEVKKAQWDRAYQDRRAKKPDAKAWSSQYGHEEIKRRLQAMSHHKCFYCERSVKDGCEVDHYIEVAERPDLAHEWRNLYLACSECNRVKQPNKVVPVDQCLDPCDVSVDPAEHLAFAADLVQARNNSERGRNTIQKYALDRLELESERRKQLLYFMTAYTEVLSTMNHEGRQAMRDDERELLRRFAQPEAPFSLMFRSYLERHTL
ncbi:HNH endonuclease [Polyangium sorediatum]|uniref:HNH endonuclease n=1 Tax=Polyangium sorediatum TaxID=889274 RepID=A0ABT6P0F8_9BACT|nr:HNH endonuclease [Polyangium sorediatum]MDI1433862.1 HNH endonuclease [Polyangium sorediatum]